MDGRDFVNPSFKTLCSRCQTLFDPSLVEGEDLERVEIAGYRQEDSLPALHSLERSAKEGCLFCAELRIRIFGQSWPNSITNITIGPATLVFESHGIETAADEDGPFLLEISVRPTNTESSHGCTLHFDLFAIPGSYGEKHLRMRRPPPWTDRTSPECVAMMHSWVSQCSTEHLVCGLEGDGSNLMPTRLIDVGPADGSVLPKLVTKAEKSNKYIALSHCWGSPGPGIRGLKTVVSTMEQHRRGIPMDR